MVVVQLLIFWYFPVSFPYTQAWSDAEMQRLRNLASQNQKGLWSYSVPGSVTRIWQAHVDNWK